MKPKVEIVITFLIPPLSIVSIIRSLKNDAPRFNIIVLSITALIWLISGIIKLYKYKKNGKIY